MLGHFAQLFIGVMVVGHSAQRNLNEVISSLFPSGFLLSSVSSVFRFYVSFVPQVEQGPEVSVAL